MGAVPDHAVIEFLKRRYASAIARGDNQTATRLRAELDRLMNGPGGSSGCRITPEFPELPPAA